MPIKERILDEVRNNLTTTLKLKKIGDDAMKELGNSFRANCSITVLDLSKNKLGCTGVKYLVEGLHDNETIKTLNLKSNSIADSGAKHIARLLKRNKCIITLDLSCNQIGADGIKDMSEALQENETLRRLFLKSNKIGDKEAEILGKAIEGNRSVTTLDLSSNQIKTEGVKCLATSLKINETITSLDLAFNPVGSDELQDIAASLLINKGIAKKYEKAITYLPCIDFKKCFKAVPEDGQLDVDTVIQVATLIRDSSNCLQQETERGILLVGKTGAGKSTLSLLLSGKELEIYFDHGTGEHFIKEKEPGEYAIIGCDEMSQTRIPNKFFVKDRLGLLTIWDLPGSSDTDCTQEIINSFYSKRVFESTNKLKFVLVVHQSDIMTGRSTGFLAILSKFKKDFKIVKSLEQSVSLVVTHAEAGKTIGHIKNKLENIIDKNPKVDHKVLIEHLIEDNSSIHLFYKQTEEGELLVLNLLDKIINASSYIDVKGEMVNISISQEAKSSSFNLLNIVGNKYNQIIDVIVKAIIEPTKCLNIEAGNIFYENYDIVKDCVPLTFNYDSSIKHDSSEYFLELNLLSELQEKLQYDEILDIPDAIKIFQNIVDIFAEYADPNSNELKSRIKGFNYCLQQDYECLKFFSGVCEVELHDHTKLAELIKKCHAKVTENLQCQVSILQIDPDRLDQSYYVEALVYLECYPDDSADDTKATAYRCLARINEEKCELDAFNYYSKAINANKYLPHIYENIGMLFYRNGEYSKAIECFKVINSAYKIDTCFEEWFKKENNADIMFERATYCESRGRKDEAMKYYDYAFSLSNDVSFKKIALKKATGEKKRPFYNFEMVDELFEKNILNEEKYETNN